MHVRSSCGVGEVEMNIDDNDDDDDEEDGEVPHIFFPSLSLHSLYLPIPSPL